MYYDNDADPAALAGQTVAIIGYGSQGHAHALNLHEIGVDVVVGLAPGSKSRALAADAGLRVTDVADAVKAADVDHDPRPGHRPEGRLRRGDRAEPAGRPPPDVRPRLQHPLRADRSARHRRRRDGRAQGPGPPAPHASTRRAAACRRCSPSIATQSGTARDRTLAYARAIGSTRAGVLETTFAEETETDLFGEQARPVRRHGGARQDGVRDARRGRLPARARLLRDDARAQAHRRPDVPRRPQLHALQRQRHRRVRRLRVSGPRIIDDHVRDDDAATSSREIQDGTFAERWIAESESGRRRVRAPPRGRPRPPDRAGRRRACGPRCRSSTRSRSRPVRPRPRRRRPGAAR